MTTTADPWAAAVAAFGGAVTPKLKPGLASGSPEDQLRAPLERLFDDLAPVLGHPPGETVLKGESHLGDLKVRPDYAVERAHALIGFIEVKAPGKGCDPRQFTDDHDCAQWEKLKALPNLIYTDGNGFSLWRDGRREGEIVHLHGDVRTSGAALAAPAGLVRLLSDFLSWSPVAPKTPKQLAEVSARLCRLLRDEVEEQLAAGAKGLASLKADWRKLLFPDADDHRFADGYAQAITFGLLMAKARGVTLKDGLDDAAKALRKTNTLIGTALRLLTDEAEEDEVLKTSLATLTRVLDVVDWGLISKGRPEAWLYFYEDFLDVYDRALRKETGSYYTPPEVVTAMVRLVDEALRSPALFNQPEGLASPEVTTADPAVGTGTFLLGALHRIAETVAADEGPGGVGDRIADALHRLIGFELQFGPFAVGQLRLLAEVVELTGQDPKAAVDAPLRLHIADTLADPDEEVSDVITATRPITDSRREANRIRREEPITVVIGNPPYKEKARGRGGWVEARLLDAWRPPTAWGVGEHAKHLRNLYVYFWRWAAWKVFGGEPDLETKPDETPRNRQGVVCFITVAGFLNGPGFQKMRADLRRDCDEIWVIDGSPEGHQPPISTRVFQGVQQPVCIVLAARRAGPRPAGGARVRFRALPLGPRKDKFAALEQLTLSGEGWADASRDPRASFLPEAAEAWASYAPLDALFDYDGSGVMPGRTWVIAPDKGTLEKRWQALIEEKDAARKALLFYPHEGGDRTADKLLKDGLPGRKHRPLAVGKDTGSVLAIERYGYRSFDRQ